MDEEKKTSSFETMAIVGLLLVEAGAAYYTWMNNPLESLSGLPWFLISWLVYCFCGMVLYAVLFLIVFYLDTLHLKGKWTGWIYYLFIPIILAICAVINLYWKG